MKELIDVLIDGTCVYHENWEKFYLEDKLVSRGAVEGCLRNLNKFILEGKV